MTDERGTIGNEVPESKARLSRRTVVGGAAWSIPVISVATAAPAFAASNADALTKTSPVGNFGVTSRNTDQTLSVSLTNGGNPVAGAVISFAAGGSPAWLSFTQIAVATDGLGVATTTLQYGEPKPAPGSQVTVIASYEDLSTSWTLTYLPNIVLVRVGDGAGALASTAAPTFLEEYEQNGTAVPAGTGGLPITPADALTLSGTSTSEGALNLSPDRKYLALGGYRAIPGATAVAVASATVPRVVGRITASVKDTSTALTDAHSMGNIRGAAWSSNAANAWTTGSNEGVRTATFGATSSTVVSSTGTNLRALAIFNSQLYYSTGSGTRGVWAVGSGLPTANGTTSTNLINTGGTSSPYGFVLLDLDPGVAGLDTAYIADDASLANGGGIRKFTYDGATWTARNVYRPGAGCRGITGFVTAAGTVQLFATTDALPGTLVSVVDTGGAGANINATHTTLATGLASTAYRGVAFAPDAT